MSNKPEPVAVIPEGTEIEIVREEAGMYLVRAAGTTLEFWVDKKHIQVEETYTHKVNMN